MIVGRIVVFIGAVMLVSGCHINKRLNPDCHTRQEYREARQMAPLKVPQGLDLPNTQGALVIPTVELSPPSPGPKDACLDVPPRYKPDTPKKVAGG